MRDLEFQITLRKRWMIVMSIAIYLLTAYWSNGYFHPDEHCQIVEFADFKLGKIAAGDLAWEYGAHIRSAFQPFVCYVVFSNLDYLQLNDPYSRVFVLRLITALLAVIAINAFTRANLVSIKPGNERYYLFLSYLLWFLPFLNVRFSSESWCGILFIYAVGVMRPFDVPVGRRYVLAGMLLGFSFLCRFQAGLLSFGLLTWLVVIRRVSWRMFLSLTAGGVVALLAGMLLDRWLYGTFVFTEWNYIYAAVLSPDPSPFDLQPWSFFFTYLLGGPMLPWGILMICSLLLVVVWQWRHPLPWIIVPFLLAHIAVGHKEERFLFPLANLVPLMLVLAWQCVQYMPVTGRAKAPWVWKYPAIVALTTGNIIMLLLVSPAAPERGGKNILSFIHHRYAGKPVRMFYCKVNPLYIPLEKYYQDLNVEACQLNSVFDLQTRSLQADSVNLLVISNDMLEDPFCRKLLQQQSFVQRAESVPAWILDVKKMYDVEASEQSLLLYQQILK